MAVIPQQRPGQWKESAIIRSEVVTDTWDVTKAWAGRFAEWVLFLCMIANIVQILPGVQLSGWFSNMVLGFQAVTLDVAGFGLATLAEHARVNGDTHTARTAQRTAYLLIGIMLVTVLSVALGDLWPALKVYTDSADRGLILVRVGMTVVYGHVVHGLRRHTPSQSMPTPILEGHLDALTRQVAVLRQELSRVEPLDYDRLAAKVVPLVPAPEPFNYERIAEVLAPRLVPEPVDYAALVPQLVPLLSPLLVPEPPCNQGVAQVLIPPARPIQRQVVPEPVVPQESDADRDARLEVALQELQQGGKRVSGRALADLARCNRKAATTWLEARDGTNTGTSA